MPRKLKSSSTGSTMWKSSWLKAAVFLLFVISSIWLSASVYKYDLSVRGVHLLSFIPKNLTSLGLLSVSPQKRMQIFSNQKSSSTEYISKVERFNRSMPWLHYYASSPKMLENYFFHGYHKGLGKYHKKFTHSQLAILPFFFDRDNLVRKCVARISLNHGMAVSHQNSMSDRWQWESTVDGLGKFKDKYQVFYGHASMGLCFQNFLKNTVVSSGKDGHRHSSEIDSTISMKLFEENMKMHSDSINCGQVLFLQHPISKAIDEYYKTFPKQNLCGTKFSESRNDDDDEGDVATKNTCNEMEFEEDYDDIIRWIQIQGNIIFKHLVFHPQFCIKDLFLKFTMQNKTLNAKHKNATMNLKSSNFSGLNETTDSNGNNFNHEEGDKIQFLENTCVRNMRVFLENLDLEDRKYLVNYVTENLPNWFSMVGLYEDLQKSWEMLDVVHRISLHECNQESLKTSGLSDNNDKKNDGKIYNNNDSRAINSFPDLIGQTDRKSVADQTTMQTRSNFSKTETEQFSDFNSNVNSSLDDQIIFQDLKLKEKDHKDDEIFKENSNKISSEQAETAGKHFGGQENEHGINSIASISEQKNIISEPMSFSSVKKHVFPGLRISDFQSDVKLCNQVSDFQKLFHKLINNEVVQKSLALDMEIYKAVKKLYQYQKQMVFNTLKA